MGIFHQGLMIGPRFTRPERNDQSALPEAARSSLVRPLDGIALDVIRPTPDELSHFTTIHGNSAQASCNGFEEFQ